MARKALSEGAVSDRAQYLLKVLIERYIRDGQPVGSRTLARDAAMDLSPATIRNVMADLEDMGLVVSPHTSAGRVPTATGYRMFVDSLLSIQPLGRGEVDAIRKRLDIDEEPSELLKSVSKVLSGITSMAGVVKVPRRDRVAFRQIEFLPLSADRVLAILITADGEVNNRIIHARKVYSAAELEQAANFLNKTYSGKDLTTVREQILRDLRDTHQNMDQIMARAVAMAGEVMTARGQVDDYVIAGETNLMGFNELADMARLRKLFNAFTEKHQILHLLDECMIADGIQIFIGEESGYQLLDDCTLVTAPYQVDGTVVGVLGVIGPTRMHYERVIPLVDVTAKLLTAALKQR